MALLLIARLSAAIGLSLLWFFWPQDPSGQSPNDLTTPDIVRLFIRVLLKYFPGYAVPLKTGSASGEFTFTPVTIEGPLDIRDENIKAFNDAIRDDSETLNPFFLAAQTTPVLIRLLADRRCPIKPLGAVNTKNVITCIEPQSCRSAKILREAAENDQLAYSVNFGAQPGHRRKRGLEFSTTTDVSKDGKIIFHMESWFLQLLPASFAPRYVGSTTSQPEVHGDVSQTLQMTTGDPHHWASTCKDYNPIHVSKLGARLFGFRSTIAHGNHVAALVLQQTQKSSVQDLLWRSDHQYNFEIQFLRPVLLPNKLDISWREESRTNVFTVALAGDERPCLKGILQHS